MNDTSPEAQKIQDELFNKLTGSQRIEMASGMFDAAREIVIASLPKELSKKEKMKAIFLRFYKDDFTEEQVKDILKTFDEKLSEKE